MQCDCARISRKCGGQAFWSILATTGLAQAAAVKTAPARAARIPKFPSLQEVLGHGKVEHTFHEDVGNVHIAASTLHLRGMQLGNVVATSLTAANDLWIQSHPVSTWKPDRETEVFVYLPRTKSHPSPRQILLDEGKASDFQASQRWKPCSGVPLRSLA